MSQADSNLSNVYGIYTGKIIDSRKAHDDLVKTLEKILEQAKSGEVPAMGFALVYHDGAVGATWDGNCTGLQDDLLLAAATKLQAKIMAIHVASNLNRELS